MVSIEERSQTVATSPYSIADVAVIFVNYNTSTQIRDCLRTIPLRELGAVVVVDNASPDDVDGIAELERSPAVAIVRSDRNGGFGHGCNTGWGWVRDQTRCRLVMFLNPDTRVEAGCIERMVACFNSPMIGAVAPRITTTEDPPNIWFSGGSVSWAKGSAVIPGFGLPAEAPEVLQAGLVGFASGCAVLVRHEVLSQCGAFSPHYFMYEEDVEFSLRIRQHGYLIRYAPAAVVRHIGQGSVSGVRGNETARGILNPRNPDLPFYVRLIARNRWVTVRLHGGARGLLSYSVAGSAWWTLKLVSFLRHGRFDAIKAFVLGSRDGMMVKLGD